MEVLRVMAVKSVVPRWEWRTFGSGFGAAEEKIRGYGQGNFKESGEDYILSRKSDENTKIRDGLMDIKSLQSVNANGLEQWLPIMKEGFPISLEPLKKLFGIFRIPEPIFGRMEYTYDQFLKELIRPNENLRVVDVGKKRSIYVINGCIVEIAETTFDGVALRTICVEHEDPENVYGTVADLGLKDYANINYIQAMKKTVGMD
jgi:exopolyphosphatase/guanosine-5'-triphosphate,3'-diphosphate pyrophosphatase